jgi:hypothetical protein
MARVEITYPGDTIVESFTALVRQPVNPSGAPPIDIGLVQVSTPSEMIPGPPGPGAIASDTPPDDVHEGTLWWKSSTGALYLWYDDGNSAQWVQIAPGGGTGTGTGGGGDLNSMTGTTGDTGATYRIVMLSNGTVTAVPVTAVAPDTPTGLTVIVKLTSVTVNWPAAARATSYVVRRNGTQVATTTSRTYRDLTTVMGNTYSYTVASVDQYKQQSPASAPITAFLDPSLNNEPISVSVTCWPLPIPTDGPAIIRVNAVELDVQVIAYTLGVDAGSLTSTQDPSVWILRI